MSKTKARVGSEHANDPSPDGEGRRAERHGGRVLVIQRRRLCKTTRRVHWRRHRRVLRRPLRPQRRARRVHCRPLRQPWRRYLRVHGCRRVPLRRAWRQQRPRRLRGRRRVLRRPLRRPWRLRRLRGRRRVPLRPRRARPPLRCFPGCRRVLCYGSAARADNVTFFVAACGASSGSRCADRGASSLFHGCLRPVGLRYLYADTPGGSPGAPGADLGASTTSGAIGTSPAPTLAPSLSGVFTDCSLDFDL